MTDKLLDTYLPTTNQSRQAGLVQRKIVEISAALRDSNPRHQFSKFPGYKHKQKVA